jgi:lipopolysaccharide export system protein LptA
MTRGVPVALLVLPAIAAAQPTQRCNWSADRQRVVETAPGLRNTYFGGNVVMRCPEKEIRVQSDSLESYEAEGRAFLIGNVRYREPRLDVDSDFMTYFQRDERVVANGNVRARLPNGSTLTGPVAEYFRATPNVRPAARLIASGRPTITLVQKDSAGRPQPPATVVANTVNMIGDSLVFAGGQVTVTREDVVARGDSMALDSQREITTLMRTPSIEGRRERPFRLAGDRIELTGADRRLRRVLSMKNATATSEDLTLASDTIDLRVASDLLQRAIAWGPARARATSATQSLVADSIDVVMPGQRVRELYAVRGAAASGQPDTIRFRADTVDWMRGDTIVARFDTLQRGADSARTRLRELHAVGNAKSFYHLAPSDTSMHRPAINYVTGREIVVDFQNQQVAKVTVVDQASGVYLEPTNASAPADSTRPGAPRATTPVRNARPATGKPTGAPNTTRQPPTTPTVPRPNAPVRRPQ